MQAHHAGSNPSRRDGLIERPPLRFLGPFVYHVRIMRIRAVLCWLLVAVSPFGCSSGSSGTAEQAAPLSDCELIVDAICDRMQRCEPLTLRGGYGDNATCRTREALYCPSYLAAGISWTRTKLEACANAHRATACDTRVVCDPGPGTLPAGSPCMTSLQCSSGYYCEDLVSITPSSVPCGTCVTATPTTPRPCGGDVAGYCPTGQVCTQQSTGPGVPYNLQCVTPVTEGGICSTALPCATGLVCVPECLSCTSSVTKCRKPAGPGEACTTTSLYPVCDITQGLMCATNSTCIKPVELQLGQACSYAPDAMCVASYCLGGVCTAFAAEGASCDTIAGPRCLFPDFCIEGKCTRIDYSACK